MLSVRNTPNTYTLTLPVDSPPPAVTPSAAEDKAPGTRRVPVPRMSTAPTSLQRQLSPSPQPGAARHDYCAASHSSSCAAATGRQNR